MCWLFCYFKGDFHVLTFLLFWGELQCIDNSVILRGIAMCWLFCYFEGNFQCVGYSVILRWFPCVDFSVILRRFQCVDFSIILRGVDYSVNLRNFPCVDLSVILRGISMWSHFCYFEGDFHVLTYYFIYLFSFSGWFSSLWYFVG
jgi:hypothetical protein